MAADCLAWVVWNRNNHTERHHGVPKQCSAPRANLRRTRARLTWRVPLRRGRGHYPHCHERCVSEGILWLCATRRVVHLGTQDQWTQGVCEMGTKGRERRLEGTAGRLDVKASWYHDWLTLIEDPLIEALLAGKRRASTLKQR